MKKTKANINSYLLGVDNMEISSEGKDILANIDEALDSEYECFQMLMAFDKGNGPKSFALNDVIKVLKKVESIISEYVAELSIYDTSSLLESVISLNDGGFEYGISYNVPKEKLIITRVINELLSKYLNEQIKAGITQYNLVLKQYLTIDFINLLISILNKILPNYDADMQKQIVIVKYQLIYCLREVGELSLSNNYENVNNPLLIHKTVQDFCGISSKKMEEYAHNWILNMYFSALNGILNNRADKMSIVDIVTGAMMRSLLLLTDEEFASDLMHETMDYLRSGKIPPFDEELIFEAITSRFEDEEIPQFLSFIR